VVVAEAVVAVAVAAVVAVVAVVAAVAAVVAVVAVVDAVAAEVAVAAVGRTSASARAMRSCWARRSWRVVTRPAGSTHAPALSAPTSGSACMATRSKEAARYSTLAQVPVPIPNSPADPQDALAQSAASEASCGPDG
jgi:hypothetical protein